MKIVIVLLALLFSQPTMAMNKDLLLIDEYKYQDALYLLTSGDYLASSMLVNELLDSAGPDKIKANLKDKANILLRISDSNLFYNSRIYPPFSSQNRSDYMPVMIKLLNTYYKMEKYEECLLFSKELDDNNVGNYFKGICLLRLNRIKEAKQALSLISKKDSFYSYARIALAQIAVIKRNFKEGKNELRNLISLFSVQSKGQAEKIYLLLGHISYESGHFNVALNEYSKIPYQSTLFSDALIGQMWSYIKLGLFENANQVISIINTDPPYDMSKLEIQTVLGYSYLKLGMNKEALDHFQNILKIFLRTEKRLERIIKNKSLRKQYIQLIKGPEVEKLTVALPVAFIPQRDGKIFDQSKSMGMTQPVDDYYLTTLRNGFTQWDIFEQYRILRVFKENLSAMKRKIENKEVYLNNTKRRLTQLLKNADSRVSRMIGNLPDVDDSTGLNQYFQLNHSENIKIVSVLDQKIFDRLKKVVNQEITSDVKKLIRLILSEWVLDGMPFCNNTTLYCNYVNNLVIADRPNVDSKEMNDLIQILDLIAKKASFMKNDAKTKTEKRFFELTGRAAGRIDGINKNLNNLRELKKKVEINIVSIDKASKVIEVKLDGLLKNIYKKNKYELVYFKNYIESGINEAINSLEAEKGKAKK